MHFTFVYKKKLLRLVLDKTHYYPGDQIKGVVQISVSAPLVYTSLIVNLHAVEVVRFGTFLNNLLEKDERRTRFYRQNILVAGKAESKNVGDLESSSGVSRSDISENAEDASQAASPSDVSGLFTHGLTPGTYSFPFSVQLPDILPPSYECRNRFGLSRMTYCAKAHLFVGTRELGKERIYFNVRMLPVNPQRWGLAHKEEIEGGARSDNDDFSSSRYDATYVMLIDHKRPLSDNEISDIKGREILGSNDKECTILCVDMDDGKRTSVSMNDVSVSDVSVSSPRKPLFFEDDDEGNGNRENVFPFETYETAPNDMSTPYESQKRSVGHGTLSSPENNNLSQNTSYQLKPFERFLDVRINGLLKSGVAVVHLIVSSLICARGHPVTFRAIVDNLDGFATIEKITFSIVNHISMDSLEDSHVFKNSIASKEIKERIFPQKKHGLPEEKLFLPANTPLTLITDNVHCRNFLEVRVTCVHFLKKFTGMARTEIAVVDGFTGDDEAPRLRTWTNDFRGRAIGDAQAALPLVNSPFVLTGNLKVSGDVLCDDSARQRGTSAESQARIGKENNTSESGAPVDFENAVYIPLCFTTNKVLPHVKNPLA